MYTHYSIATYIPLLLTLSSSMAAYLVGDITRIHDESTYGRYRSRVSPGIAAAGGSYLVRGGPIEVVEGRWQPGRLVIVRFPSVDIARRWWASPEYAPLREMRQRATETNMVIVDGVPDEMSR
jgi:uncharacterized protein (DUF1330 family)